jgi:hypothetical protein
MFGARDGDTINTEFGTADPALLMCVVEGLGPLAA